MVIYRMMVDKSVDNQACQTEPSDDVSFKAVLNHIPDGVAVLDAINEGDIEGCDILANHEYR